MNSRIYLLIGLISQTNPIFSAEPPSKVTAPVKEAELPTLHLTPQAVQRLGIVTAEVTKKDLHATRSYPGIVRWPAGSATDAMAPAPLASPEELRLLAERQTTADGTVTAAQAALEAASLARQRASTLAEAKAGSSKILEEAAAAELQAKAASDTAKQQRALLGQPAADIARNPQKWISVAVPVTDLVSAKQARETTIKPLGQRTAKPIPATLAAREGTALLGGSVELFYAVSDAALSLGQSVEVTLTSAETKEPALTVPWSAVVYDATGGSWIYAATGPETFSRRRVSISRVSGDTAILTAGPAAGTKVVTVGVAELFGAEFGGFK
jgi:multidrug efflux pump subunit AcrA (membrane-fusion protein)